MGEVRDLFQDRLEILEHLPVRKTKDQIPLASEVSVTLLIVGGGLLSFVSFSIQLHYDPPIATAEIRHEWTDRVLAMELQPMKPAGSQSAPQCGFRRSRVPPKIASLLSVRLHSKIPQECFILLGSYLRFLTEL
jgi:hypothetical protein